MEILVILLLIPLNGLFAMSEIALISARRSNLEMQARQGSAGARQALKLAKDPDRFLSTVQIGITPDRHSHGYLLPATRWRRNSAEAGPAGHSAAHGDRHGAGHDRHRGHLPHDHIRRTGPQTHRHERRRASRKNRRAADAAAFGRGVALRVAALRSTAGVARLLGLQRAESKVTEAEIRSIIQEGAETARCRRSNSRSWAASSRWATAPWSRS